MNKKESIKNRINEISKDTRIFNVIRKISGILKSLNIDFIVIGSCGLQSYFDCFYRLPNDLDIVVRSCDFERFVYYCRNHKIDTINQLGRIKLICDQYPIHVMSDFLNLVDKTTGTIFASIDLRLNDEDVKETTLSFPNCDKSLKICVPVIEFLFCINLTPPLDSNTVLDFVMIFEYSTLDIKKVREFLKSNPDLRDIIHARAKQLCQIMKHYRKEQSAKVRAFYSNMFS